MPPFQENIYIYIGLVFILYSIAVFIFPPKFGSVFYGITTKWTIKNEAVWALGQKLFAVSFFVIGIVMGAIGNSKLLEEMGFTNIILFIALTKLSKYFVHRILSNKYPNI